MNVNQLFIFYGSSPGAGKSTLSSFLYEQLRLHNIPTQWVYEEDVLYLDTFAEFIHDIQNGNHNLIVSLLEATSKFVDACLASGVIVITDSIFPCFNWLIATSYYSRSRIETFSSDLERILTPLRPLIIYLNSNVETALKRAVQQRGAPWLEDIISTLNTYGYNKDKALQDIEDVIAYFETQNQLNLELLTQWSCDILTLDTTDISLDQLKTILLKRLGLSEKHKDQAVPLNILSNYVGVYRPCIAETPTADPLVISLVDGALWINTYWPNGCPLIPESITQFRLQNISHRIEFEKRPHGPPRWLTYDNCGNVYRYERISGLAPSK
jgi:thymidylate kinase